MSNYVLLFIMLVGVKPFANELTNKLELENTVLKREVKRLNVTNRMYRKKIKKLEKKLRKLVPEAVEIAKPESPKQIITRDNKAAKFVPAPATHKTDNSNRRSQLLKQISGLRKQIKSNKKALSNGKSKYAKYKKSYHRSTKKRRIPEKVLNNFKQQCYINYERKDKLLRGQVKKLEEQIKKLK